MPNVKRAETEHAVAILFIQKFSAFKHESIGKKIKTVASIVSEKMRHNLFRYLTSKPIPWFAVFYVTHILETLQKISASDDLIGASISIIGATILSEI